MCVGVGREWREVCAFRSAFWLRCGEWLSDWIELSFGFEIFFWSELKLLAWNPDFYFALDSLSYVLLIAVLEIGFVWFAFFLLDHNEITCWISNRISWHYFFITDLCATPFEIVGLTMLNRYLCQIFHGVWVIFSSVMLSCSVVK